MSEHRYDVGISDAMLLQILKMSKDRTKTTLPVSRRGKDAHGK